MAYPGLRLSVCCPTASSNESGPGHGLTNDRAAPDPESAPESRIANTRLPGGQGRGQGGSQLIFFGCLGIFFSPKIWLTKAKHPQICPRFGGNMGKTLFRHRHPIIPPSNTEMVPASQQRLHKTVSTQTGLLETLLGLG